MVYVLREEETTEYTTSPLLIPKYDAVFHALFCDKNVRLVEAFVGAILKTKIKIKEMNKNRIMHNDYPDYKVQILDLLMELESGEICHTEVQLAHVKNENERMLCYWAKTYSSQLLRGKKYESLKPTISIIIVDHIMDKQNTIDTLDSYWEIVNNKDTQQVLTNHFKMYIIEIPKALKLYEKNKRDSLAQWMMFLNDPNNKEVSKIMTENEDIQEARDKVKEMSEDIYTRNELTREIMAEMDYVGSMDYAREEGMKKGTDKAKKKIAIAMHKAGMSIEQIVSITGLTREQVIELK